MRLRNHSLTHPSSRSSWSRTSPRLSHALGVAFAIAFLAPNRPAQTCSPEYDVLYGGYDHWVALRQSSAGHVQGWTMGDGGRIRVLNSDPQDPAAWEVQGFDPNFDPGTYDQIFRGMDFYERSDGTTVSIVVGDEGQWAWCNPAESPDECWIASNRVQDGTGVNPDLWDIAFHLDEATEMLTPSSLLYVVGREGFLGHKALIDSGHQWSGGGLQQVDLGTNRDLLGIDIRAGRGIVVGANGAAYYNLDITDPSGWSVATLPFSQDIPHLYKVLIDPTSPNIAYAVGGVGTGQGFLYRSVDSGATWTFEPTNQSPGTCPTPTDYPCPDLAVYEPDSQPAIMTQYDVAIFPDGAALSVGYGGQVLRRAAGGVIWEDVTDLCTHSSPPLWGVTSLGPNGAMLTGMFGCLRQTNNQGVTWSDAKDPISWRLQDIESPPAAGSEPGEVIFMVGAQKLVVRSLDAGATWTEMVKQPDSTPNLMSVACSPDGVNDVAVGEDLTVYFTTDGLSTTGNCVWFEAAGLPASTATFREVAYAGVDAKGQNEFWAVGTGNSVYRSDNGGVNWCPAGPMGTENVDWEGVSFLESGRGVLVGHNGGVGVAYAISSNTWRNLDTAGSLNPLYGVHIDNGRGFAVGQDAVYEIVNGQFSSNMTISQLSVPAGLRLSEVRILAVAPVELVVAGDDGHLWTFESMTWTRQHSLASNHFRGIDFPSKDKGFLMGAAQRGSAIPHPISPAAVPTSQPTVVVFERQGK